MREQLRSEFLREIGKDVETSGGTYELEKAGLKREGLERESFPRWRGDNDREPFGLEYDRLDFGNPRS